MLPAVMIAMAMITVVMVMIMRVGVIVRTAHGLPCSVGLLHMVDGGA